MSPDTFRVQGCPPGDGDPACHRCQGWLKKLDTARMTKDVNAGKLNPTALCDPLRDRALNAYESIADNSGV